MTTPIVIAAALMPAVSNTDSSMDTSADMAPPTVVDLGDGEMRFLMSDIVRYRSNLQGLLCNVEGDDLSASIRMDYRGMNGQRPRFNGDDGRWLRDVVADDIVGSLLDFAMFQEPRIKTISFNFTLGMGAFERSFMTALVGAMQPGSAQRKALLKRLRLSITPRMDDEEERVFSAQQLAADTTGLAQLYAQFWRTCGRLLENFVFHDRWYDNTPNGDSYFFTEVAPHLNPNVLFSFGIIERDDDAFNSDASNGRPLSTAARITPQLFTNSSSTLRKVSYFELSPSFSKPDSMVYWLRVLIPALVGNRRRHRVRMIDLYGDAFSSDGDLQEWHELYHLNYKVAQSRRRDASGDEDGDEDKVDIMWEGFVYNGDSDSDDDDEEEV